MVDEGTIRAHLQALRALLAGAHERCEALLRDVEEGRIDPHGADDELKQLCVTIGDLTRQCQALEAHHREE